LTNPHWVLDIPTSYILKNLLHRQRLGCRFSGWPPE
jgi:hypothetical protein